MVTIERENKKNKREFIVKGSVAIEYHRSNVKNAEQNSLVFYKKSDKKHKTIAIIQVDDLIEFEEIKNLGIDGIKLTTNLDTEFSHIQMGDKIIYFFTRI